MKFYFFGYFASFLTFLEHSDGGEACKIQNKLKFGWKNEIWNIQAYLAFLAKIPKFFKMRIYHPKYIFFEFYKTPHHPNALKMSKMMQNTQGNKISFSRQKFEFDFFAPKFQFILNFTSPPSMQVL